MQLSQTAYAKHRGVSETAVRKAIKEGRITKNKNGKIDPKVADEQWLKNTDPAQIKNTSKNELNLTTAKIPSYQESRSIKEDYQARLKKLEFERESKKLIPIEEVKLSAFNTARMTRDRILNIPDRVAPIIIGKSDIHEIKEILKKELTKALEELSKNEFQ